MFKFILYFLVTNQILVTDLSAQELNQSSGYLSDGMKAVKLTGLGAIDQFYSKTNLYALPLVGASLWYSFEEDDRISNHERSKRIKKPIQLAGDFAVVASFPIIPITTYYLGKSNNNEKLVEFSIEYFSTLYLTLIESAALSLVQIHERPKKDALSPWETNFRGNSSFPSGHVVPYSALLFKTFQFYGPMAAILPATLTYMASKQRIQDGKHYLSDVVGGIWLSYFASEGVRKANNYQDNSSMYKQFFEGEFETGIIYHRGVIGPKITYTY